MRILVLSGSIGERSCTRTLLRHIETRLKLRGVETIWWDLREKPLPIAIPEYHKNQQNHPKHIVREFVSIVESADGFVLGSPLYHDSYSGVLKNALDNLPHEAFSHKPVGLASHSSNARSCVTPCNQLRPVIRSLAGYATQSQVGTTDEDYENSKGELSIQNPNILRRVDALIDELLKMSQITQHMA